MNAVAAPGTIAVTHQDANGTWLIALRGEHDLATRPRLERETRDLWPLCTVAVIDLSDVEFIDSGVITWLLKTKREREASGACSLRIVVGQPGSVAARGLAVFGVREVLECYPTLEDALAPAPAGHGRSGEFRQRPHAGPAGQAALDDRSHEVADSGDSVGELFDRVGARAWALAVWVIKDERLAEEIVVASFARAAFEKGHAPGVDAGVLCDVRRASIVVGGARPNVHPRLRHGARCPPRSRANARAAEVRDAITALPEAQRSVIELALFGRLSVEEIATATRTPRADVLAALTDALLALRPIGRAKRSSPTASGRP